MNDPQATRKVALLAVVVLLLGALGMFIWALITQNFELRRKAASGEETPTPTATATALPTDSPSSSPTSSPSGSYTPTPTPTATPANTSCIRGNQVVSLTPTTQSGRRGQGLTYTVKVKNTDSDECKDKENFSLSAILPYSNWSASFAQSVISLSPGAEGSTTVTFTSSSNSPYGTLPVGVNTVGIKSAVVAAANYEVLVTSTASPKPANEVVYVNDVSYQASSSASPEASVEPVAEVTPYSESPQGFLSKIPTAAIYALGGFLLIVLFFVLRALFSGGNKNNPPKMTPPTQGSTPSQTPSAPQGPQLSHSVDAPIQDF